LKRCEKIVSINELPLLLCIAPAAVTALLCLLSRQIGEAAGLMDRPDNVRKLHTQDTPLTGGIAVMIPVLAVSFVVALGAGVVALGADFEKFLYIQSLATALILLLGVVDDRFSLTPFTRLFFVSAIVLLALFLEPQFVVHNFRIVALGVELPLGMMAWPLTLLMVAGFINAVNMADGMNGQLMGAMLLWSIFILCYANDQLAIPYIALLLSLAVALFFNLRGRLFSGSAGSYAFSLFVGLSAIYLYRRSADFFYAEIPVYWFWLPVIDCLRLFVLRLAHGRSAFAPDRDHFHHVLLDFLGPNVSLIVYLLLLGLPGAVAILYPDSGGQALILCVAVYVLLLAGIDRREGRFSLLWRWRSGTPRRSAGSEEKPPLKSTDGKAHQLP
jgi:UDP-GlcNAc:undecaprenyl-phosphate GlcNAc-1-phosphate transferase